MTRCITLLTLLLALPAAAQQPEELVVGVYTPRAFFPNSLARSRYAEQVANQLEQATGVPMKGRGFVGAGEFESQVAGGRVHFAVVDPQYQVARGYSALAQATAGGRSALPMVLVVGPGVQGDSIADLRGKRLARVKVGGQDAQFVTNYLLQGQVDPDWLAAGKSPRDVAGALSLVRLGKADAAFTYQGHTGGLRAVFTSRPVPLPVFVQTARDLDAEVVAEVRGAIGGVKTTGAVTDGFGPVRLSDSFAGALRRGLARPGAAPVPSDARGSLPRVPEYLDTSGPIPYALPPVSADLATPPPPPDIL